MLATRLVEYVSACFTGLWVQSHEHPDALTEIARMCREEKWRLAVFKTFCLRSMRRKGNANPLNRPKGCLLLSPPGCGKSQFAKCLGTETGRPTLILDIGSLMGSLVGSTEGNIRQALKIVDAMSPCVVMVDEVE